MKISYNWIKSYVKDLPAPDKVAEAIIFHAFEVEGKEQVGDDTIFDIKILPDRAHDCLSHQGIAREVAGILGLEFTLPEYKVPESKPTNLQIDIQTDKCRRYMGRIVRNVKVGQSPEWVKNHLELIGQRSINNIVDATNIVMYDCGQPLHAFDLDKLAGEKIVVRTATDGEQMTTLDNKEIKLSESDAVITDGQIALAIAGVKGGKTAQVDENTKNILIEVANFDATSVRKTAHKVNIFTDSSKRFENDLSPELCDFAMKELSGLLVEYGITDFEEIVDIYPVKQQPRKLEFSVEKISKILGLNVSVEEIEKILKQYNYEYKQDGNTFEIVVPYMRMDLNIEEDMAEEIGRVLGYDKVTPEIPKIEFKAKENDVFAKITAVRAKLLSEGYSEVMTYSFTNKGDLEVLASASDKKFLRSNISDSIKKSYDLNKLNAPLLGLDEVKIFEIGAVFLKDKEEIHVCLADKKGIKEVALEEYFATEKISPEEHGYFSAEKLSQPQAFKMWSVYPFITRDVAVWVSADTKPESLVEIYKNFGGDLLITEPKKFDQFTKGDKTSYAYRLVFQSYERTLTDEEINKIMTNITEKIVSQGWEVR